MIHKVIISPCLLGFQVYTQASPNGFIRPAGLYSSFGDLIKDLIFTEGNFTVEVK